MITLLRPNPPSIDAFAKYLQKSYAASTFSNGGPCVQLLEQRLGTYLGMSTVPVLQCNATAALTTALQAFHLTGCEILTPSFTFAATAHSILNAGCLPVFVDIEPSLHMSLDAAERLITSSTKALVVVQALGFVCDYVKYEAFARKHNLLLIFDSAAALGASYADGSRVGTKGHCEVFSLHITKTFGIGEGGLISSQDGVFLNSCRRASNFGFLGAESVMAGSNSKCSEFHAAVGLAVLDVIDEKFAAKRCVSDIYDKYLEGLPVSKLTPRESGYQVYPVLFSSTQARDRAMAKLAAADIGFRTYYVPLHTHPYFSRATHGEMSVTEDIAGRILCLPFYEGLERVDITKVAHTLGDISCAS